MKNIATSDRQPLSTPPAYLVAQNLSKAFGTTLALNGVNLTVDKGTVVTILGPSGSGKSTLLRVIAGLEEPDDGEVRCNRQTFYSARSGIRLRVEHRDIGMVFQDFGLWPHLTALEHVTFPLWSRRRRGLLQLSPKAIYAKAMETLAMFRMEHLASKHPYELSGGQQQRVAFARAVAARPSLVLLDEAFSALDPQLRGEVREDLMGILRAHQMTVLNVTHDLEEAMATSDRILVLHQGIGLQFAAPDDLYYRPNSRTVAEFIGKGRLIPVRYDGGRTIFFPDGQRLELEEPLPNLGASNAQMLIRPEFLRVCENPSGASGVVWSGRVMRRTGLVGRTELLVDIDNIGKLAVYHQTGFHPRDRLNLELLPHVPHLIFEEIETLIHERRK